MSKASVATPTQLELSALPTFHLCLVVLAQPSPEQVDGLKRLLNTLFGIDLLASNLVFTDVTAHKPLTSPLNTRVSLTLSASPRAAQALVRASEAKPLQERIHAVWVVLPHSPSAPNDLFELRAPAADLVFPIETLLLIPSPTVLPEQTATSLSIALRHQGLPQPIVHFAPSLGAEELARVSEATERLFVSHHATAQQVGEQDRVLKRLVWVAAQRVSRDEKIATAVAKGMKLFAVAVGASAQPIPFIGGATGVTAIGLLQTDIMAVYNFNDPSNVLKSRALTSIFYEAATGLPLKWAVSLVGLSWVSGLWEAPGSARTIMQSIADLTLILDALFLKTLHPASPSSSAPRPLTAGEVKAVIAEYEHGPPKPRTVDRIAKRLSRGGSAEAEVRNARFSREEVHKRLGRDNISTFNVWKSLKRHEAQAFLEQVIREHRYQL